MVSLGLGARLNRAGKAVVTPPANFSPSLNTTLAWYDVGDVSTVHHTSNAVTTLDDLSGNARHISNTGSNRPTYDGANDKITFDGSNDYLYHSSPFLYAAGEYALYAVLNATSGGYKCLMGEASTSNALPGYCPLMTGAGGADDEITPYITTDAGAHLKSNTSLGTAFTGGKKIIRLSEKNGYMCAWIDGVLCSAPRTYTRGTSLSLNRFALGCRPENNGAFFAGFELYELVIAPNDDYGQQYEGYLAHKHGLTGSLPSGHPYKTDVPVQGETTTYEIPFSGGAITAAILGDSITATNTVTFPDSHVYRHDGYFVTYNALAKNRMFLPVANNQGVGGEGTDSMLARIDDLDALDFDVCFFMGGTNDIAGGENFDAVRNEVDEIFNYITIHLEKTVVALTVLPRTHVSDGAAKKQRIRDLNAHIMNAHGSRNGRVISVNLYDAFDDGNDEPAANLTYDGLHPTAYGAMVMGQTIAATLQPYFGEGNDPDYTAGNLLSNGIVAGTGGGGSGISGSVATSYICNATAGTPAAAKDSNDRQILTTNHVSTGGSDALSFLQSIGGGYTNGDTIYAMATVEITDVANIDRLQLELCLKPDSVQTHWRSYGFGESGHVIAETYLEPGLYTITTPPIAITTGSVTGIEARLAQQVKDGSTPTTSTIAIHGMGIFKL